MSHGPHRRCKPRLSVFSTSLLAVTALVSGLSFSLSATPALAQAEKKPEKKDNADELPPKEEIELTTEDGLAMKATYFPGSKGKESIPVILLHGFSNREGKHSRADFTQEQGLAPYLQEKLGCAVIVPDLRGHGESTTIKVGKRVEKLDAAKLRPPQISAMVTQDLRAVKDFLWKENNKEKLNIDKLAVIGVEEGAALALSYTWYDSLGYEQQMARYGPLKLGGFVKAAVLISPATKVTGLKPSTAQAMKVPEVCRDLPVMIIVGNKNKTRFAEAEHLCSEFLHSRPPPEDKKLESKTVFFFKHDTALQGTKLLAEPSLNLPDRIVAFLTVRLVKNEDAKEYAWKERKLPHQ
jgi:pimeloyl-ACP methyl ester carboxylesterase